MKTGHPQGGIKYKQKFEKEQKKRKNDPLAKLQNMLSGNFESPKKKSENF